MKPVLVYHTENFLTSSHIFENYRFDILSGENLDKAMFRLAKELLQTNCNSIFIMVNLSSNYLELAGFRMAHYMRLSDPTNPVSKKPIILIGVEEITQIIKITPNSDIFRTQGIYYSKLLQEEIDAYLKKISEGRLKELSDFDEYLNKISIKSPTNYSSHHSVTNEWSLYRWSKSIGLLNSKLENSIEQELYYLYLFAKHSKNSLPVLSLPDLKELKGKILLIDDESDKGWYGFFKFLVSKNNKVVIDKLDVDFSRITEEELCIAVEQAFPSRLNIYDVVLLDVRLIQDDFISDKREFSSHAVLEKILAYNKGIQVIIFTASNKKWNYSYFQNKGVLNYITKESPEYTKILKTSESIDELIRCIGEGLESASFFKKIAGIESDIVLHISNLKTKTLPQDIKDLLNRTIDSLDMAWKLLKNSRSDNSYLRYAFLAYYQILEDFVQDGIYLQSTPKELKCIDKANTLQSTNNILGFLKKDKTNPARFEVCIRGKKYYNNSIRQNTLFKVSIWLHFRVGTIRYNKWAYLNDVRNNSTHGNLLSCTEKDVEDILRLVSEFVFNA